jgi:hypothetical protein
VRFSSFIHDVYINGPLAVHEIVLLSGLYMATGSVVIICAHQLAGQCGIGISVPDLAAGGIRACPLIQYFYGLDVDMLTICSSLSVCHRHRSNVSKCLKGGS